MNIKTIAVNGIVAALYIAVTGLIAPFAFGPVQYRISEVFNHMVVFNKKYFFGVVIGVFLSNLLFSDIKAFDLTFGVAHSIISLGITVFISRFVKNVWARMVANTLVFTGMMFIIAWQLNLAFGAPFWETYLLTAIGEFVVMAIGIPVMYALNKRVNFDKAIEK